VPSLVSFFYVDPVKFSFPLTRETAPRSACKMSISAVPYFKFLLTLDRSVASCWGRIAFPFTTRHSARRWSERWKNWLQPPLPGTTSYPVRAPTVHTTLVVQFLSPHLLPAHWPRRYYQLLPFSLLSSSDMSSKSLVDPAVPPHLPVGNNMSAYLAGRLAFPFATTQHVAGAKVVGKTGYYAPPGTSCPVPAPPGVPILLAGPSMHLCYTISCHCRPRRRGTTSQLLFPPLLTLDLSSKYLVDPVPPPLPASNMSAYLAADRAAFSCTRVAERRLEKLLTTSWHLLPGTSSSSWGSHSSRPSTYVTLSPITGPAAPYYQLLFPLLT
jgi:hypothetical protein